MTLQSGEPTSRKLTINLSGSQTSFVPLRGHCAAHDGESRLPSSLDPVPSRFSPSTTIALATRSVSPHLCSPKGASAHLPRDVAPYPVGDMVGIDEVSRPPWETVSKQTGSSSSAPKKPLARPSRAGARGKNRSKTRRESSDALDIDLDNDDDDDEVMEEEDRYEAGSFVDDNEDRDGDEADYTPDTSGDESASKPSEESGDADLNDVLTESQDENSAPRRAGRRNEAIVVSDSDASSSPRPTTRRPRPSAPSSASRKPLAALFDDENLPADMVIEPGEGDEIDYDAAFGDFPLGDIDVDALEVSAQSSKLQTSKRVGVSQHEVVVRSAISPAKVQLGVFVRIDELPERQQEFYLNHWRRGADRAELNREPEIEKVPRKKATPRAKVSRGRGRFRGRRG